MRGLRVRWQFGRTAVKSMMSAMSVAMSLMQVPSGIGGGAGTIAFRNLASKVRVSHQPPEVGRLRSFLGTIPPPKVWCGPAELHPTILDKTRKRLAGLMKTP